jgi:hypothetical protein
VQKEEDIVHVLCYECLVPIAPLNRNGDDDDDAFFLLFFCFCVGVGIGLLLSIITNM